MSNIDVFLCDVISLLAQIYIVSFEKAYKEVSTKNIELLLLWWIDYDHISVLYKFQIDISTKAPY